MRDSIKPAKEIKDVKELDRLLECVRQYIPIPSPLCTKTGLTQVTARSLLYGRAFATWHVDT